MNLLNWFGKKSVKCCNYVNCKKIEFKGRCEDEEDISNNMLCVDIKGGTALIEIGDKFKFTAIGMDYSWIYGQVYEVVDIDHNFKKSFNKNFDNITLSGALHTGCSTGYQKSPASGGRWSCEMGRWCFPCPRQIHCNR